MKPIIYHTGFTPPPSMDIDGFEICYYPVLKVEYISSNIPQDISDFIQLDPIILIMSKNAVIGLDKWFAHFNLKSDFFSDTKFWTIGDRTHACLKNILGIQSFYPDEMTGRGVVRVLYKQNYSRILLISSHDPRQDFVEELSSRGINFFHFPVYKTYCEENLEFSSHFKNDESNYLVITSPSTLDGIMKSLFIPDLSKIKSKLISIGPTTSAAIRKKSGDVFLESKVQNINILYDHLSRFLVKRSK